MEYKHVHYDYNLDSFEAKTDGDYIRQETIKSIFDWLNNTDWEAESKYHNHYRVNGKTNYGRTIKMKNKDWHKLNKS